MVQKNFTCWSRDTMITTLSIGLLLAAIVLAEKGNTNVPFYYLEAVQQQQAELNSALSNLTQSPIWDSKWPSALPLGQVSGVSVTPAGHVLVLHRGARVWDAGSFDAEHHYTGPPGPIPQPTLLELAPNGTLLHSWGENLFYMPHGLTAGANDTIWITDVALHQVLKFGAGDLEHPVLSLGTRLEPGRDDHHMCKPSAVAELPNGDFFVSDGYCNSRILKFDARGRLLLQFGRAPAPGETGPSDYALLVPHALTLAGSVLCVADRERGRVACFRTTSGTYLRQYTHPLFGRQIFSVAYSPARGGMLYVVTGALADGAARGFVLAAGSGELLSWFGAPTGLRAPHALAVAPDGGSVYVAELERRIVKLDESAVNVTAVPSDIPLSTVKPFDIAPPSAALRHLNASTEWSPAWWWWGAAGVAGAAGTVLLARRSGPSKSRTLIDAADAERRALVSA